MADLGDNRWDLRQITGVKVETSKILQGKKGEGVEVFEGGMREGESLQRRETHEMLGRHELRLLLHNIFFLP